MRSLADSARGAKPEPLGATVREGGVSFAVAAPHATHVHVCVFDEAGREERISMPDRHGHTWSVFVPGLASGTRYGYRADGPWDPAHGWVFNPSKLLIDPYTRATAGTVTASDALSACSPRDRHLPDERDSAPYTLRSVVLDAPEATRTHIRHHAPHASDLVIYEAHVRGLTATHPAVPEPLRGTYAGAAHPAVLSHLIELGINAVEFLPVQQGASEPFLTSRGLTNYWNYSPIAWFAPHAAYSAEVRAGHQGGQVSEFQAMVRAYHDAGIAVIVDVVYNHTAEGRVEGPMLSLRGLANHEYYRVDPMDGFAYLDTTGCGNAVRTEDAITLRLVLDSLRYWATEMGVDGFRFDLAPTLARDDGAFHWSATFLDAVHADPILRDVILIDEPWDVGRSDSYQVGRFPPGWHDWNDRYRDVVRDFWRGIPGQQRSFASVISGSAETFSWRHQGPSAAINFITAHDGFTLTDLVSYDEKHNDANGQLNLDGTNDNRSWNCGVEGPTEDPVIRNLRTRQAQSMLATLFLSWGIPMLTMGDELGRTQLGNNNAYCQDNAISWIDWDRMDHALVDFTRRVIAFRLAHPILRSSGYPGAEELTWIRPDGAVMEDDDWHDASARSIAWRVIPRSPADAAQFFVMCNAWVEPVTYCAPMGNEWPRWKVALATAGEPDQLDGGLIVPPHSMTVMEYHP